MHKYNLTISLTDMIWIFILCLCWHISLVSPLELFCFDVDKPLVSTIKRRYRSCFLQYFGSSYAFNVHKDENNKKVLLVWFCWLAAIRFISFFSEVVKQYISIQCVCLIWPRQRINAASATVFTYFKIPFFLLAIYFRIILFLSVN